MEGWVGFGSDFIPRWFTCPQIVTHPSSGLESDPTDSPGCAESFCKAQIPLRRLSPRLPCGERRGHKSRKSWTQTILTCRDVATKSVTSPRQTRLCRSNGMWSVTMHRESQQQSPGQVPDKVADLSRTQIAKVSRTFMICICNKSATLSRTCRELCRKVSVIKFGFNGSNKC